ncbi:MAG: glycosyltransferase family 2 protein [Thermoleophilia bacterium]|nr:glycosyltransferase family 2 protein [Thermoleophilia bacterium]
MKHSTNNTAIRASIVIPTYNGVEVTRACIESLIASGWNEADELIVVDNASTDGTRSFLDSLDGSVTVIPNKINRNFAGACNQGAAAARGKYIVLLNNDTEVTPGWLDAMIATAELDGADVVGSRLLYPDGRIQHAGIGIERGVFPRHLNRYEPADSPGAATSFACQVVTGACMLVVRDRWAAVGGLDQRFRNGCEDIDFCLRVRAGGGAVWYCAESVVTHHESLSPGRNDHDAANAALLFALHGSSLFGDRISGDRIVGLADPLLPWRRAAVTTSIIIPLFNRVDLTRQCIESIFEVGLPDDAEVIVVDNASTDGTQNYCDKIAGQVRVVRSEVNINFAGACNRGMAHSLGAKLVFLNNDTQVTEGWLEALTGPLDDPRIGIVGGRLLYPNGQVQHAGVAFGEDRVGFHVNVGAAADDPAVLEARAVQAVTGACMAIDRDVFLKTLFCLDYRNGCEDLELCLRAAQLGVATWYAPSCVVIHHESQSTGRFDHASQNLQLFLRRWHDVIVPDVHTFTRAQTASAAQGSPYMRRGERRTNFAAPGLTQPGSTVPNELDLSQAATAGDMAAAFGTAADAMNSNTLVVSCRKVTVAELAAIANTLGARDAVTGATPDVVLLWGAEEFDPVLGLTRTALDRVGGVDTGFTLPEAATADIARRCQLAGLLVADVHCGEPQDLAATTTLTRLNAARFAGTPDEARWAERWNISSTRTEPRELAIWTPLIPQLNFAPGDLDFITRDRVVLLSWRDGTDETFAAAVRELLHGLDSAGGPTLVVRTGGSSCSSELLERAAREIADDALPDIVVVAGGLDTEAALCSVADVVIIPDAHSFSLMVLARASGAQALSADQALKFLFNTNQTRSAA